MATDFFSTLGKQLCAMRNSPFYPLGQKPKDTDSLIRSQLSYDPNRLFNRQKYEEQNRGLEDRDLIEMRREEDEQAQRVEFQILKNATMEDYEKRVQDLRRELERGNTNVVPSIFKTRRTVCLGCNRCGVFKGNFKPTFPSNLKQPSKPVDFLCCLHCRCSMSAHAPSKINPLHRPYIWRYLKGKQIKEDHIEFNGLVIAFKIAVEKVTEEHQWDLLQILQKMGFQVLQQEEIDKHTFQFKLIRSYLLGSGQQPGILEGMLELAQCIHLAGGWKQKIQVGEQFKDHLAILKKVAGTVRKRSLEKVEDGDGLILLIVRYDEQLLSSAELRQALKQLTEYLPYATITHVSASKRQALFQLQQLFPGYFQLHQRLFLLPKTNQAEQNEWKFQDMLDYNGYSSFIEGIKDIKRNILENILDFLPYHEMTYLLGKDIVNEKISKFGLYYAVKAGQLSLNYQGQLPSYLEITNLQHSEKVVNALLPTYLLGQRCIIVIRPLVVKLSEIIANILRLNGFLVIQRRRQRLSEGQARFMAALEHITQQQMHEYLQMMTSGSTQILLVSKRGALFQANALLNSNPRGLATINTRWITETPTFEMTKGRQVFKQELIINSHKDQELFRSAADLISLEKCLLGRKGKKNVLESCKSGELLCVQRGKIQGQFKGTARQREQILRGIREDTFNYLLFSSKSDSTTEELASLFFPQTTLFDSAIVIVKPAYMHLIDSIKHILAQYRYHFIFHKSVNFSKILAYELLSPLQKLKVGSEPFQEVIESFAGNKSALLCISKIGAKRQILALLSSFTFLPSRTALDDSSNQSLLREALIPVWTSQQLFLRLFNRHLSSLEQAVQLVTKEGEGALKPEEKMELYQYFIGSLIGVRPTDHNMNTSLGRFTLYNTDERVAMYQSWYYASMSQVASIHVPLIFQYRAYESQTLVLQPYPGQPFMSVIVNQYLEQMRLHQRQAERYSQLGSKKRSSLVLLLWAKKIFQLAERISGLDGGRLPEIQVHGWGSIVFKNGLHCGQFTAAQAQANQRLFLQRMLAKYQGNRIICSNIKKLLESRLLVERYNVNERRLLPICGQLPWQDSLRVVETGLISKIFLKDQFQMLDPDHQKQMEQHKQLLAIRLFRVDPIVAPKYTFLARLFLFFQKWKQEALDYRKAFQDIYEHLKGMVAKYDDLEFLEYEIYLESLHQLEKAEVDEQQLKAYPSLRRNKARTNLQGDEAGKNRKFLEQKQYFKPSQRQTQQQIEEINQKYGKFNLKTLEQPLSNHILNLADDPLHKKWATQQNFVNLLREEGSDKKPRVDNKGVFVQYEKRLNQNEERLKQQIQIQVNRLHEHGEDNILKDNGLDPDIWYKRVKGGSTLKVSNKVDEAILKQLAKLNQFKASSSEGFATK